ncbi:MAG: CPBP family intramembrane glutamic endopeptidase [Arenimonas sp.]
MPGIFSILGAVVLDIGLFVLFSFVAMIAMMAIWTVASLLLNTGHSESGSEPGTTAQLLIASLAMYLAIVVLSLWRGRRLGFVTAQITSKKAALLAASSGIILFLFTLLATNLLEAFGFFTKPSNQEILENLSKQWPVSIMFFVVVIAPVFEELFFRKQLFARMAQANHLVLGYVLSSLLFALLHEPAPTSGIGDWLLKLFIYGSMGAVFAWVYKKTGKLWPAIVAHASNNLLAVIVFLLFS